jgi:hypothetical protein
MVVSLAPINTIMPIISFLFVFILVYAVLVKTKVLGENNFVSLFIALIVASFFIVNVQLVEFVKLSMSWVSVFLICLFLILVLLSFVGKESLEMFTKGKAVAGIVVAIVILLFALSSSYAFNWAINWDLLGVWSETSWFGMVLLLIVAGVVSYVLAKK